MVRTQRRLQSAHVRRWCARPPESRSSQSGRPRSPVDPHARVGRDRKPVSLSRAPPPRRSARSSHVGRAGRGSSAARIRHPDRAIGHKPIIGYRPGIGPHRAATIPHLVMKMFAVQHHSDSAFPPLAVPPLGFSAIRCGFCGFALIKHDHEMMPPPGVRTPVGAVHATSHAM